MSAVAAVLPPLADQEVSRFVAGEAPGLGGEVVLMDGIAVRVLRQIRARQFLTGGGIQCDDLRGHQPLGLVPAHVGQR
jgi:hypothetical protein